MAINGAQELICLSSFAALPKSSVIGLNPAIHDQVKTGQRGLAEDVIVLPCRRVVLQGDEWRVDVQEH
jgi:hypothetical protein